MSPSPELKLIAVMVGAFLGVCLARLIEKAIERRERRRRYEKAINDALDARFRRGMRGLTEEELREILTPPPPITMRDFRVTERGRPMRFEDDHRGDAA